MALRVIGWSLKAQKQEEEQKKIEPNVHYFFQMIMVG